MSPRRAADPAGAAAGGAGDELVSLNWNKIGVQSCTWKIIEFKIKFTIILKSIAY